MSIKHKSLSKRLHSYLRARFFKKELKSVFDEAYYDRERAELVSIKDYPCFNVLKGEVLMNSRYRREF
ncbi:MAG: hypothetical protein QXL69_00970 [Candidatus Bathyarchaeia archaeon]|nr:hypothetical protein [Candidatus Bathyarchaeota archaeon]